MAPGLSVIPAEPKEAVQPTGKETLKLKVELGQAEVLLLVTETV